MNQDFDRETFSGALKIGHLVIWSQKIRNSTYETQVHRSCFDLSPPLFAGFPMQESHEFPIISLAKSLGEVLYATVDLEMRTICLHETNWKEFSPGEYMRILIFSPHHPFFAHLKLKLFWYFVSFVGFSSRWVFATSNENHIGLSHGYYSYLGTKNGIVFSCNDIIKVRVSFKKWITLMIYVSCSIHSWFVKCLWGSCNKNNVASIVTLIYPLLASYILTICPSWCFLGWTGFFVKR